MHCHHYPEKTKHYYPFGMQMKTYQADSSGYRYGFGGMEKDDDIKGSGNSLDFGARIYDSRLGKWLSSDPLEYDNPSGSTYTYGLNSPLFYRDPDGKWVEITTTKYFKTNKGEFKEKNWYQFYKKTVKKEIDIKIHNLKIYIADAKPVRQGNAYPAKYRAFTDEERSSLGGKIKDDVQRAYGNESATDEKGKEVVVSVSFANEPVVVNSLSEVNSTGKRPDDLVLVVANSAETTGDENSSAVAATHGRSLMVIDGTEFIHANTRGTYVHEFTHQRYGPFRLFGGDQHTDMGVFYGDNGEPNFNNLWNLDNAASSGYKYKTVFIKYSTQEDCTTTESTTNTDSSSSSPSGNRGSGMGSLYLDQLEDDNLY